MSKKEISNNEKAILTYIFSDINYEKVQIVIKHLTSVKACGHDNINPELYIYIGSSEKKVSSCTLAFACISYMVLRIIYSATELTIDSCDCGADV